jgi:hypothetical protein
MAKSVKKSIPSAELHQALDQAYTFFNKHLFDNGLPGVFWTTVDHRSIMAHYRYRAWVPGLGSNALAALQGHFDKTVAEKALVAAMKELAPNGDTAIDEMMVNPRYMLVRGPKDFISSIVHEQVHQMEVHLLVSEAEQARAGGEDAKADKIMRKAARSYHSKFFAAEMAQRGLQCSKTGRPSAKGEALVTTGDQMDHYIIKGGVFDKLAAELLSSGWDLPHMGAVEMIHGVGEKVTKIGGMTLGEEKPKPAKKRPTRFSFLCPNHTEFGGECKETAMARPGASLCCGQCEGKPALRSPEAEGWAALDQETQNSKEDAA